MSDKNLRSRTKNQPANERRNLIRGPVAYYVAKILAQHADEQISLDEFYSTFQKLRARGVLGYHSESAIRAVLVRFRDKGLTETSPAKRLRATRRYYRVTMHGKEILENELQSLPDDFLSSKSEELLDRVSSNLRKIERSDKDEGVLGIEPRELKITDIFDTKQARFEKQEFECRIDEHIARYLHEKAFENRPSKDDRSRKVSHSEESFTLVMTHKGWMKITPKRADYIDKIAEWASKSGLSTSDVLLLCRDIMNQNGDMTAILEIPVKQRLKDGEVFFLRWKYEGKVGEVEYVRSHQGEMEVRSDMNSLTDFMTIFAGTSASVWPEFSNLRESVRDELQSMKTDLDQGVFKELKDNRKRLSQLEVTVQQLIGLLSKYLNPQPQKASDESEPDYIG